MRKLEFEKNEEIEKIIENSRCRIRSERALAYTAALVRENGISIEGYKWQALANHVVAMVNRSITKEVFRDIDPSMFRDISSDSICLAEQVAEHIGGLDDSEKYLLSVHFEVAKVYAG